MLDDSNSQSAPLWRWPQLTAGLTGREDALGEQGPDIAGVCVDTRRLRRGELFVALPGDPGARFNPGYRSDVDGHDYVRAAAAAGAAGALVHKPRRELHAPRDFPLIRVADTYDGLWDLGRLARSRMAGDVVAVTGSSGKTTAKNFLSAALHAYAPPGSFNNHIGVPLSLANAPADVAAAVFEIGTNHPGEIAPLAEMVAADVAVLLNVHAAHIENFADEDELKLEKVSIFNSLTDKSKAVSEDILQLGFGHTFGATRAADARLVSLDGDRAAIDLFGARLHARVPGGGRHRAVTVTATLLTCHLLGRDLQPGCELATDLIPAGRGNLRQIGGVTLVDDSYNANPASMRAALESFAVMQGPAQRIAVIGEMLELGGASAAAHMDLAPLLQHMDGLYFVGAGTRALAARLRAPWQAHADAELCAAVVSSAGADGAVLVKGSNRVFWANGFVDLLADELSRTA